MASQIEEGHAQGRLVLKGEVYKIDRLRLAKLPFALVLKKVMVKAGQVLWK